MNTDYVCLQCGSKHGEPTENQSENWYWKVVVYGRIGPFCSAEHANAFRFPPADGVPRFTLQEWERLRFIREMLQDPGHPLGV